jgi:thioredoxin-like negative regulator of GroEL
METAIEGVAEDGVEVLKVDTEENPGAASEHGVRSVPTLVVFEDGGAVRREVGGRSPRVRGRVADRIILCETDGCVDGQREG